MKLSIYTIGAFLTVSLCSVNTHMLLPVPPPVVFLFLALLFLFIGVLKGDTTLDRKAFVVFPLFLLLLVTQLFFTEAPIRRVIAPIIALLFFPVSLYFLYRLTYSELCRIVKIFIVLSVVVLTFETIYRFAFPNLDYESSLDNASESLRWIYMFKGPSLVYVDSNGTALHALIVLFFVFYWSLYTRKSFFIYKLFLILIIILTFSRAAWLGLIVGIFYFYLYRDRSFIFKLSVSLTVLFSILLLIVFYVLPFMMKDASLLSKFEIMGEIFQYFEMDQSFLQFVFTGVGVSMSVEVLGIYAHNYWAVWLIEAGFLALLLQMSLWILFYVYTKKKAMIILLPFFLATLSSNLTFAPVFYVAFAVMYYTVKERKERVLI